MVRQVAASIAGKGAVVALNTDEHPRLAGRFGVRGIPALFLLKEGKVVEQMSGAQPLQVILAWFERHA